MSPAGSFFRVLGDFSREVCFLFFHSHRSPSKTRRTHDTRSQMGIRVRIIDETLYKKLVTSIVQWINIVEERSNGAPERLPIARDVMAIWSCDYLGTLSPSHFNQYDVYSYP